MKKTIHKEYGFTLMELLVAMAVFLIVISLSGGVFMKTLRSQRAIANFSENMNNITLVLEQIAREVRTGFEFVNDTPPNGTQYDKLKFRNGRGKYVLYEFREVDGPIQKGQIYRCESFQEQTCDEFDAITSLDADIKQFKIYIKNKNGDNIHRPPLITIAVETYIDEASDSTLTLQTSVSSRILDYDYQN